MTPEQIRRCREAMRLSQPAFGERIGVGRMTINHYEHGRRHDTRKPIEISKTADMACAAAWLGVDGFEGLLAAAEQADVQVGNAPPILPSRTIEPWLVKAAEEQLVERGFDLGEHLLAFPLLSTLAVWSQITRWCPDHGISVPTLHPVISAKVPGIAILEFGTANDAFIFLNTCTGGGR